MREPGQFEAFQIALVIAVSTSEKYFKKRSMEAFIQENKELVWIVLVVLFTIVMIFISVKTLDFMERKLMKENSNSSVFKSLRRIARTFFVLLGGALISYLFFNESTYEQ